jgi:hypothetical protein
MGKYTPPAVTFRDVLAALPPLRLPLALVVTVRPARGTPDRAYADVELVHYDVVGACRVYKRWGREVRSSSEQDVMRALLLAAQEAYLYLDGADVDELARYIEWQLGIPKSVG